MKIERLLEVLFVTNFEVQLKTPWNNDCKNNKNTVKERKKEGRKYRLKPKSPTFATTGAIKKKKIKTSSIFFFLYLPNLEYIKRYSEISNLYVLLVDLNNG